jgi:acyl-CoA hydrolase
MAEALTLPEAAGRVRRRDSLAIPLGPGQPASFMHALGARDDFEDLLVFGALLMDAFPILARKGVKLRSGFFGPVERGLLKSGFDVEFIPADFRRFEDIASALRPRIVATSAAPPDADRNFSLSLHAGATVDELRRAGQDPDRLLIVEVNDALPRTLGLPPEYPHSLHEDEIDIVVTSDRAPFTLADPPPGDVDRAIAAHARRFISDGSTLQTGIGSIPSAIAALLASERGGDYGIHSEMFTDGLMKLHEAGKVSNRKGHFNGYSITTFALGTNELYQWLDGNDLVRFLPVERVNSESDIARNRRMISINGAMLVDLAGQVAADALNGRQYSGIGGHNDFAAAATRSKGGRSLICMPATARAGDATPSRIVDLMPADAYVTTPRHEVDVIITEHGAAELRGRTVSERAAALIEIAAPQHRAGLREAWERRSPKATRKT